MFLFAFIFRSAFLTCAQPHDPLLMLDQSPSNPKTPPYKPHQAPNHCRRRLLWQERDIHHPNLSTNHHPVGELSTSLPYNQLAVDGRFCPKRQNLRRVRRNGSVFLTFAQSSLHFPLCVPFCHRFALIIFFLPFRKADQNFAKPVLDIQLERDQ